MAMKHIEKMLEEMDIIVFDGPPVNKIGDQPYMMLTSHGEKPEGMVLPDISFWSEEEAWWNYKAHLREALWKTGARQLAWRWKPTHEVDDEGRHYIKSRLALLQPANLATAQESGVGY